MSKTGRCSKRNISYLREAGGIFVLFVVCAATALGATVAVVGLLPVAVLALSKDQSKDEEENIDFSISFSFLSKCQPGQ